MGNECVEVRLLASCCSDVSSSSAGFLDQLKGLFQDEDPSVRMKTCELLHIVSTHCIGR